MANADKRYGFKFAYTKHGGPPQLTRHYSDGVDDLHIGDIVDMGASGRVAPITAATNIPYGVSASYLASGDSTTAVYIYNDLQNTIFQAQCASSVIAGVTATNIAYDISVGTATTNDISEMEVNDAATTNKSIWVIDKVDRPDNDWGLNVDVYCEILVVNPMKLATHAGS